MERKKLTLDELDAILYVNENGVEIPSKTIEREEQVDATLFIPRHAVVLELGGRYGLAAAVINNQLDTPTQHIVVEPDSFVQDALRTNRDSHNCFYSIFEGIVSRKPMYFNRYGFSSFCSEVPNDTPIRTISLEELQELFGISQFTHLVADCEGGLVDFFQENKEFIATLEGIYFEKDNKAGMKVDYESIQEYLNQTGFVKKKSGFREYWEREKLGSANIAEYCQINATDSS